MPRIAWIGFLVRNLWGRGRCPKGQVVSNWTWYHHHHLMSIRRYLYFGERERWPSRKKCAPVVSFVSFHDFLLHKNDHYLKSLNIANLPLRIPLVQLTAMYYTYDKSIGHTALYIFPVCNCTREHRMMSFITGFLTCRRHRRPPSTLCYQ